ncbi:MULTISPECIES: hypothetical protein [Bacteria]|uniref:hypothetical protein n=1 Tax=Bacteria TaxID=2 RepID=UPI003C7C735A
MAELNLLPRRTIVKGVVWSVPVIAAALAVPSATASGPGQPRSVGSLVESSPNIKDTVLSASSSRVESCFPSDVFSADFSLTATVTYTGGDPAFSLAGSTVTSAGAVWRIVSATRKQVTMTATQRVSCYAGITGFDLAYNAEGCVPSLNTVALDISGVSIDGERQIDDLISALDGGAVVGPRVHDA